MMLMKAAVMENKKVRNHYLGNFCDNTRNRFRIERNPRLLCQDHLAFDLADWKNSTRFTLSPRKGAPPLPLPNSHVCF